MNRLSARILPVVLVALGLSLAAPGAMPSALRPTCALAAGNHRVAVEIEHGSGASASHCVYFSSDTISGEDALRLTGVQYQTSDFYGGSNGLALCQVEREPATYPPDCLNQNVYWNLWLRAPGGGWIQSRAGLGGIRLGDGDWIGMHFVRFHAESAPPVPAACAAAAPTPTAAPTSNPPPTPSQGSNPSPTPAPEPAASAPQPTDPTSQPASSPPVSEPALSTPKAVPPATRSAGAGAGVDLGWLAASIGGGALLGLLVIQLVARRRL